ncbi:MAG: iron uptake porin, partial [Chroococcidiopsidaceae cyanobacterium CP_BM_RX_35]|nr:iron uptake porin [Chroococcidiopsidaceae cyanobacterium CP_BM_RX_35]
KLAGEAILAANGVGNSRGGSKAVVSGRARGSAGRITDNATFSDRVRLSLNTSFTGQDLLRTRLQARNTTPFGASVTGTNETRLGFDGDEGNTLAVDQLFYRFPLFKNAIVQIDAANTELNERGFSTFSPFESSGLGSISRYGRFSPIYRIGNSTTNVTNSVLGSGGAGASVHINPQGIVGLDLAYLAPTANNPNSGFGITNGAYAAVAQVDINASKYFNLGLTYAHSYDSVGRRNGTVSIFDSTGTQLANSPFGNVPTSANNYGVEASIRPNQHLILFGWGGYTQAYASRSITTLAGGAANVANGATVSGPRGAKADIWYFAGGIALPDIGSKGSMLGLLFGEPPRVTSNEARETRAGRTRRVDNNPSYQAELFYRYRLTDNIAITPGALIIFNPEGNSRNAADYVGTLRTTFTF